MSLQPEQSGSAVVGAPERDQLITDHLDRLYRYFYRRLGRHHDAEDLTYDTISHVLRKWERYNPSCPFWPWLVTVARNLLVSRARKKQPLAHLAPAELVAADAARTHEHAPTVDAAVGHENRDRLRDAINALPRDLREAVLMYYYEDLSAQQIAAVEQVPVGTVYRWLSEGRDRLGAVLGDLAPQGR
jgi:RNA polymerase sigma-70 factor (ECF subfamily)